MWNRVVRILSAIALGIVLSVTAHAEFGQLPKLPGRPKLPGAPATAAQPGAKPLYCAGITDESIDRYLKAIAEQKKVLAAELAAAAAMKAKADVMTEKRGKGQFAAMVETGECTDAFKDKDPRSREIARLDGLAEAATNQGNEAKAEEYQKKSSQLGEVLEADADRACGGRGAAALFDCGQRRMAADPRAKERDKLRQLAEENARQGNKEKQAEYAQAADQKNDEMRAYAQMECMQEAPGISGTPASAEEEAASNAAAATLSSAKANADKAGSDAAGLTSEEFTRLDHCIRGVLAGNTTTPATPDSTAAINRRSADLNKAVGSR